MRTTTKAPKVTAATAKAIKRLSIQLGILPDELVDKLLNIGIATCDDNLAVGHDPFEISILADCYSTTEDLAAMTSDAIAAMESQHPGKAPQRVLYEAYCAARGGSPETV